MRQLASSDLGDLGRDSIAQPANLQEAGESSVTSSEDRQTDSAAWEQYRASRVENEPCTEPRSCPGMCVQQLCRHPSRSCCGLPIPEGRGGSSRVCKQRKRASCPRSELCPLLRF